MDTLQSANGYVEMAGGIDKRPHTEECVKRMLEELRTTEAGRRMVEIGGSRKEKWKKGKDRKRGTEGQTEQRSEASSSNGNRDGGSELDTRSGEEE